MSGATITLTAWASLAITAIFVLWRPRWLTGVTFSANAMNVVLFAITAMLFVVAYPDDRRVIAICAIILAIASELLAIFTSSRHAEMRRVSVKAVSALAGVLMGAIVLHVL